MTTVGATDDASRSDDSVVVLLKGGRIPSWRRLTPARQDEYSSIHVELMLSVAHAHGMLTLEGFKLLEPKQPWERFWILEFPTLEGAEAWIRAEMEPPYGAYGFFDYRLARRFWLAANDEMGARVRRDIAPPQGVDPRNRPPLAEDIGSVVVLEFTKRLPDAGMIPAKELKQAEAERRERMRRVSAERGLIRLEAFRLIAPQPDWQSAAVIEVPDFAAAEAWMEAETTGPDAPYASRSYHLARRWAPDFFRGWLPPAGAG